MGFIEETGAAQYLRDARITTIYEGTTGIQAADLIGRKVARDGGKAIRRVIAEMRDVEGELEQEKSETLSAVAARLRDGIGALEQAVQFVVTTYGADLRRASVGAVPFLELFGGGRRVAVGPRRARRAAAARRRGGRARLLPGEARHRALLRRPRPRARPGLARTVVEGAEGALAIEDDQL